MGYHNDPFPSNISHGSAFGPSFKTLITEVASGGEERTQLYGAPRYRYDISYGIKTKSAIRTLVQFFIARSGATNAFPFEDPLDYSSASDWESAPAFGDQILGTGDGTTTTFQLAKRYTSGGIVATRPITKPQSGTVLIGKNGSNFASSNWSVDTLTGIVTFNSAPAGGDTLTWGGKFYVPVRFESGIDLDGLRARLTGPDVVELPSGMGLVEVLESTVVEDELYMGGGSEQAFTGSLSLSPAMGRLVRLAPTAAATVQLQSPSAYPTGGPHWVLWNDSAFTVTVKQGATTVGTLTAGKTGIILLFLVSSAKTWKVVAA